VASADEAILALDSLNTTTTAIYEPNDYSMRENISSRYVVDSLASISLKEMTPNYLKYESKNSHDGFAVFSEIYYKNGWKVSIDGSPAIHLPVNYILRGMPIPAGNHTIEFKFDPDVVKTGSKITLASSILLCLLLIGGLFYEFKRKDE
ncbi:YfhO family protein, partial [Algibacter sp.]|uniref:YfhO family protein n=1 Tax=Algibacter sp. TaxID=1872428 RepID=UPI003C752B45